MIKKHKFASGRSRLAAIALAMVASGPALSYDVIIDDMQMDQGSAGAPAVSRSGPGTSFAAPFMNAGIYGNYRHIGLTNGVSSAPGAFAASWVDKNGNDAPLGTWQVALPSGNSDGFGEMIYNGSSNLADTNLPPLNLNDLVQFTVNFLYADHSTTYFMQVFSANNACTQATIADIVGETTLTNLVVPKSAFTAACPGIANPANLSSIKKIRIVFTGGQTALDTDMRGLIGTFLEPPQVQCVSKTMNGTNALVVDTAGPYNLTIGFSVSNTGQQSSLITVQDLMPPGMTPTGPVTCATPAGFTFGGVTTPEFTWNSSTQLAAGQTANCTFPAVLNDLGEGQVLTNIAQAAATGSPFGPSQCRATIRREVPPPPPEAVPTLNEWGMMLTAFLLAVLGGLTLHRRGV